MGNFKKSTLYPYTLVRIKQYSAIFPTLKQNSLALPLTGFDIVQILSISTFLHRDGNCGEPLKLLTFVLPLSVCLHETSLTHLVLVCSPESSWRKGWSTVSLGVLVTGLAMSLDIFRAHFLSFKFRYHKNSVVLKFSLHVARHAFPFFCTLKNLGEEIYSSLLQIRHVRMANHKNSLF